MEKVQFLFFKGFLLVLTKFSFWEEGWRLGYNSMKFRDFPEIFLVRQLLRQLLYTMLITNNHTSIYSWWKRKFGQTLKVSKYYERDCRCFKHETKGENMSKWHMSFINDISTCWNIKTQELIFFAEY